jgi:YVTN family beta-propeller protein
VNTIKKYVLHSLFGIILPTAILLPSIALAQSSDMVVNPNTNRIYIRDSDNKSILVINGETNKALSNIPLHSNPIWLRLEPSTIIQIFTVAGGFVTVYVGLRTYSVSQTLRKKDIVKDIVFPLKEQFDMEEVETAKYILDDVPIKYGFYDEDRLSDTLRDHRKNQEGWSNGDGEIRYSFDRFLDFLSTLEYLVAIGLINKEEKKKSDDDLLYPFRYFIDKAAKNKAVVNYVKIYNFPLYGRLHPNLNSNTP